MLHNLCPIILVPRYRPSIFVIDFMESLSFKYGYWNLYLCVNLFNYIQRRERLTDEYRHWHSNVLVISLMYLLNMWQSTYDFMDISPCTIFTFEIDRKWELRQ